MGDGEEREGEEDGEEEESLEGAGGDGLSALRSRLLTAAGWARATASSEKELNIPESLATLALTE